ncbi:MAG: hypothetical protein GTO22_12130 [Gemmatimonadales bacterium]|nr:hypothetical protein [Gemmatimonadales bacterium]
MSSEEIIVLLGGVVLGVLGSPTLMQWIKKALKLEGSAALVLSYVVALAIAFVALLASGEIGWADLTLGNFFSLSATIIAAAQFTYKILNPTPQT